MSFQWTSPPWNVLADYRNLLWGGDGGEGGGDEERGGAAEERQQPEPTILRWKCGGLRRWRNTHGRRTRTSTA